MVQFECPRNSNLGDWEIKSIHFRSYPIEASRAKRSPEPQYYRGRGYGRHYGGYYGGYGPRYGRSYGYGGGCGPFRRRACYPALRAGAVVGGAAFGGALLGSALGNRFGK